ncbi:probable E3 ubiquitin-protein ligase MID2 [Crassostrea angulata]|uniref:probable E3 ubiquitin-protein ligase MID2 n=1 Tax=Magallana angulata TaxID=2784310 RepID=UPI0022B10162|nr:probable E3 ubiquitin-protein ligase MID2 [Crassostrea angulata]
MATSAVSGNKPLTNRASGDTFRCPICLEEVRNPKYLSCLHTFCESCIQTYISSTATCHDSLNTKTINCPVCRKRIDAPRKDISDEEWASSLPQNKLIVSMWLNSNPDKELCKFCERKEKKVSATHWCKACMETICDECKAFHDLVPSLQNHKIVNMADTQAYGNDVEVEELCLEHKGKVVDAFCHYHQKLCCCICLASHHISCQRVQVIADMEVEQERTHVQNIVSTFSDLEESIKNMQQKSREKIDHLNSKKQEICMQIDKAITELKTLIDDAHTALIKQFDQTHSDSIGNLEIAFDELKRFSTTVCETKVLLQLMLEKGSPKQLFVTKQNQLARINDHISCLKSLDVWTFPEDYTLPDSNFLDQLFNKKKLEGVKMSKTPSGTIETILQTVQKATSSDIMRRKHDASKKDWMKVTFKLVSQVTELLNWTFYGIFTHDTKILFLSQMPPSLNIFDISEPIGKCVHTEECQYTPYGLCHSRVNESLNEVYVSFQNNVVLYLIDIRDKVTFTKLRTIQLNKPMLAISCGMTTMFSANNSKAFICSQDFTIEHETPYKRGTADVPLLASSSESDFHCFTADGRVVVSDRNKRNVFQTEKIQGELRGMTFDLHDNIFICNKKNKIKLIKQIKFGGSESREIELDGISAAYNVALHPTGEKMLVLDFGKKCCVYQIM